MLKTIHNRLGPTITPLWMCECGWRLTRIPIQQADSDAIEREARFLLTCHNPNCKHYRRGPWPEPQIMARRLVVDSETGNN